VRGRPRPPASQGSVEKSHGPYKKALLAKLKEHNIDNWVDHMYIVQCEVNNCPIRSHGDIKLYTMYYSKTNKSCYSATLGRCYKEAKTEYELRLAKIVLDKIKELDDSRIMTNEEVSYIIKCGDDLFLQTSLDKENRECDKVMLHKAAIEILGHFHYDMAEEDLMAEEAGYDAEEDNDHDFMDWSGELS
jgi:hypothetical protein